MGAGGGRVGGSRRRDGRPVTRGAHPGRLAGAAPGGRPGGPRRVPAPGGGLRPPSGRRGDRDRRRLRYRRQPPVPGAPTAGRELDLAGPRRRPAGAGHGHRCPARGGGHRPADRPGCLRRTTGAGHLLRVAGPPEPRGTRHGGPRAGGKRRRRLLCAQRRRHRQLPASPAGRRPGHRRVQPAPATPRPPRTGRRPPPDGGGPRNGAGRGDGAHTLGTGALRPDPSSADGTG